MEMYLAQILFYKRFQQGFIRDTDKHYKSGSIQKTIQKATDVVNSVAKRHLLYYSYITNNYMGKQLEMIFDRSTTWMLS